MALDESLSARMGVLQVIFVGYLGISTSVRLRMESVLVPLIVEMCRRRTNSVGVVDLEW